MDAIEYLKANGIDPTGWKVQYAQRDGECAGIVMVRGPEVHIHPMRPQALSRKNIRETLAPILAEHGYVTTRVPLDVIDHRLREHLGFRLTWADDRFTYWALTELPYSRKDTPCQ